jgi:hypothetical protein
VSVPDAISLVAAFAVTAWFVKTVLGRDRDEPRHAEDDARTFFDEHGHWPDEDPAEAAARAERGAAAERLARASGRRRR